MSKFYISEILYLAKFTETNRENDAKLADIQKLVFKHLQNKEPQLSIKKEQILWYNTQLANFKIELVREIIRETQYANWDKQIIRVIVLLNFTSASLAAQNALLKLIEEPPPNTLIILPVVSDNRLLSTISSRCNYYQIDSQQSQKKAKIKETNWPNKPTAIFTLIEQHKDREAAKKLIQSLLKQKLSYRQKKALSRAYLDLQANANVRLTLEHCFLTTN